MSNPLFIKEDKLKNVRNNLSEKAVYKVEIEKLSENQSNFYDISNLDELIESIKISGLITPIEVTPDLVVLSGHRRLEACKNLNLKFVDVIICSKSFKNKEEEQIYIIEANRQRIKTKTEINQEIIYLKQYYTDFKNNNPDFKGNINKLIAQQMGVSERTVIRNKKEVEKKVLSEEDKIKKELTKTDNTLNKILKLSENNDYLNLEQIISIKEFKKKILIVLEGENDSNKY